MPPKRKCRKSPGRKSPCKKRRCKSPPRRKSPSRKRKHSPRRAKSPVRKRVRKSVCKDKSMSDCKKSDNCRWIQYVNSNGKTVRYCRYQSPKKHPSGRSIRSVESGCKGKQMRDCNRSKNCKWIEYTNRNGKRVKYCRYQPTGKRYVSEMKHQTKHHNDDDEFSIFLNNEIKRAEVVTKDAPKVNKPCGRLNKNDCIDSDNCYYMPGKGCKSKRNLYIKDTDEDIVPAWFNMKSRRRQ